MLEAPHRALPPGALAGAGLFLGTAFAPLAPHVFLLVAPFSGALLLPGFRDRRARTLAIVLAFTLLGAARASLEREPRRPDEAAGDNAPLYEDVEAVEDAHPILDPSAHAASAPRAGAIAGTITVVPVLSRTTSESVSGAANSTGDEPGDALFEIRTSGDGAVRVRVRGAQREDLARWPSGAHVRIVGRLFPPREARNPGDRDRGTQALLVAPSPAAVSIVRLPETRFSLVDLRARLSGTIDRVASAEAAGVLHALLLGDRRLLSPRARRALERTGTVHYLAISGLHVGMLLLVLRRLPLPFGLGTPARLAFLALFAILTGGSTPVVRAVLMATLQILAVAAGRMGNARGALGWAVVLLLAVDPSTVEEVGFQLSVIAVAAILTWGQWLSRDELAPYRSPGTSRRGLIREALGRASRALRQAIVISTVTSIATTPLIAFHFGRFHPLAGLWTVIVWPLVATALISGLLVLATGIVDPKLALPFAAVAVLAIDLLLLVLERLAEIPASAIDLAIPSKLALFASYGVLALGLLPGRIARAALGIGFVVAVALLVREERGIRRTELIHFDVGRGTAVLVRVAPHGAVLIDAGGTGRYAGPKLLRALKHSDVGRLDAIVLSHLDSDHTDALPALIECLPVERIFAPPIARRSARGAALARLAREREIPLGFLSRGDEISIGENASVRIRALHPQRDEALPLGRDANEASIVVSVRIATESGELRYLSPGDIEEAGVTRILQARSDLRADVLLLPHHGRRNDRLPLLVDAVRPRVIIIAGDGRGGALENAETLERDGFEVFATWRGGAIRGAASGGNAFSWSVLRVANGRAEFPVDTSRRDVQ
ncbi:MAG TPA: ComEC/Rec2 family competence protein [Planctomycetota bacterium]|nr:ComEC/Rec2 family competence protein [Planctomycetota bacterium]